MLKIIIKNEIMKKIYIYNIIYNKICFLRNIITNNYFLNNNNNNNETSSSSDENILDDQNYIIQKKNMNKNYYEILYVKRYFYISEIKRKFYNLSLNIIQR
ncbi:hypothetical protein PFMALIP_00622 [Plasmodium falciparum MaliPS096_E11]|uniref:Uncharacterized protein n=1 Tax=Plasmodium falciparum MaliPS096_E11 TaxID=1036727 RepID=A0A024WVY6_PLAFA|nr:hypothetical protein PFMALIP_00622 [Plasmodium falciparum MaliPS096_E11]